jgi:hypothetical protein
MCPVTSIERGIGFGKVHTFDAVVDFEGAGAGTAVSHAIGCRFAVDAPKTSPWQAVAGVTAFIRGGTDSGGNYLSCVKNSPAERCELEKDGAGDHLNQHGKFQHDVAIVAGRTNTGLCRVDDAA